MFLRHYLHTRFCLRCAHLSFWLLTTQKQVAARLTPSPIAALLLLSHPKINMYKNNDTFGTPRNGLKMLWIWLSKCFRAYNYCTKWVIHVLYAAPDSHICRLCMKEEHYGHSQVLNVEACLIECLRKEHARLTNLFRPIGPVMCVSSADMEEKIDRAVTQHSERSIVYVAFALYRQILYSKILPSSSPHVIGERYYQTISILCLAAPLHWCELNLWAKCWTNSKGPLYHSLLWAPNTLSPSSIPSVVHSQRHSDNFGYFLRLQSFAMASAFL